MISWYVYSTVAFSFNSLQPNLKCLSSLRHAHTCEFDVPPLIQRLSTYVSPHNDVSPEI